MTKVYIAGPGSLQSTEAEIQRMTDQATAVTDDHVKALADFVNSATEALSGALGESGGKTPTKVTLELSLDLAAELKVWVFSDVKADATATVTLEWDAPGNSS